MKNLLKKSIQNEVEKEQMGDLRIFQTIPKKFKMAFLPDIAANYKKH
jgi:hypothetical protein